MGGRAERQCAVRVRGVTESSLMDLMQQLVERFPGGQAVQPAASRRRVSDRARFRGHGDLDAPLQALMAGLEQRGVAFDRLDD